MRRSRAVAQLLVPGARESPDVVRHLVAVQAQDARACRLALRARGVRRVDEAGLCVTWLMRGTLHLVAEEDLAWLHAVTAPTRLRGALTRLAALGVDDPDSLLARVDLPCDRAAVAAATGLSGQAVPNLLMYGALRGRLVRSLDGVFRAAAVPAVGRERALVELGRRYAASHARADARDLAKWAGIPLREVRLPDAAPVPEEAVPPRLLGAFDEYLLGWADRSFAVPPALEAAVAPGGGIIRAAATIDGTVVGTWTAPGGRVALDVPDRAPFAAEINEVESFLGRQRDQSSPGPRS